MAQKSAKRTTAIHETSAGFTAEERAAMKERAKELKAEARANKDKAAGERDVLAKIAEMPEPDRAMAERLHAIITASAPDLSPKTWYGMPAYARDGKVVCFFTPAQKFNSRYATFGFNDDANLDDGTMWPTSFALTELTAADEAQDRRAREESGELRTARRHPRTEARFARNGDTMSMATMTDTRSPALHVADSHDLIRVHGARENNLKDVSVEIPKRRLTVFTGVSGSGKSSLVFDTIAAESQRLINETYSAFVQGFMPTLARPEVDVLEGLTTAIIVDQERMGANPRSTVGTATDANAMLRILFSRLGQPHIGPPNAYSFNVPLGQGERGDHRRARRQGRRRPRSATFTRLGGMCPRCEGMGSVTDFDLSALYDDSKSLNEGALTIPGYSMDGWYGRIFRGCGFFDPDKPIREYTKKELHDLLHKEPTKIKVDGINLTYAGLIPQIQKSFLSKDNEAMQPHIRAFVERAVTFTACPDCGGTRLSEAARSSQITGINIADACAMQISDLAEWVRGLDEPSVAPLLAALGETLDSFVEIGLGYLSLDRPSGTLSGGEAQRTKMIRHLGSSLTDVTYVFDEPTAGLHPHDVQRMNDLLLRLRDKGNTVLVVEHEPETIAIADHVVDLGPGAGTAGGEVVFEGTVEGLRASGTITGRHLDDRAALKADGADPDGQARDPRRDPAQPARTSTSTSRSACCAS